MVFSRSLVVLVLLACACGTSKGETGPPDALADQWFQDAPAGDIPGEETGLPDVHADSAVGETDGSGPEDCVELAELCQADGADAETPLPDVMDMLAEVYTCDDVPDSVPDSGDEPGPEVFDAAGEFTGGDMTQDDEVVPPDLWTGCGDGQCLAEQGETCFYCPDDCGECCGDASCESQYLETCESCPEDCGECLDSCGDGLLDPGEQCDDGNLEPDDGCDPLCLIEGTDPMCGDGVVEGPGAGWPDGPGTEGSEWCDDGNLVDGDGCSSDCTFEDVAPLICGNGIVEAAIDETCEPPETQECDEFCHTVCPTACCDSPCCGDGVLDPDEECDDGNGMAGDGCDKVCLLEVAGPPGVAGTIYIDAEILPADNLYVVAYSKPGTDPCAPLDMAPEYGQSVVAPQMPYEYQLPTAPGTYYIYALLTTGPEFGCGPEDYGKEYPEAVVVPEDQWVTGIDITLEPLGYAQGEVAGAISCDIQGGPEDSLVVMLSADPPPDGVALYEATIVDPLFPQGYSVPFVEDGDYYVYGCLDIGTNNTGLPTPDDYVGAYLDSSGNPATVCVFDGKTVDDINFHLGPQ